MKGFGIEIKNNLLEPKHVKNMSTSVWLYMWLVDKVTSITEDQVGIVLGGKPIMFTEIKEELDISQNTYSRWINRLSKYPYITTKRTPHGIIFQVFKIYKKFKKRFTTYGDSLKTGSDSPQTGNVIKTIQDNNNIKKEIYKERKLAKPAIEENGKRRYGTLDSLTPQVLLEIAMHYHVPPAFVRLKLEAMKNWLEANGKTKKNYKAQLSAFVLKDIERKAERQSNDKYRAVDARMIK